MTKILISDQNPEGQRLEDILTEIRSDTLSRCTNIADDQRPEAVLVMNNNVKVLALLSEAIDLARASTSVLDKSFGSREAASESPRRIGAS